MFSKSRRDILGHKQVPGSEVESIAWRDGELSRRQWDGELYIVGALAWLQSLHKAARQGDPGRGRAESGVLSRERDEQRLETFGETMITQQKKNHRIQRKKRIMGVS